jgi:hypothetical protein
MFAFHFMASNDSRMIGPAPAFFPMAFFAGVSIGLKISKKLG